MNNIARPNKLPSAAVLRFPLASPPTPPTTPSPPSGLATKRKAEEDNNTERKSAKHQRVNPPAPKRKATVNTTTIETQSVKRQNIAAPDQSTPSKLAKSPEAAESFKTTLNPAVNFSSTTVATDSTQVRAHTLPSVPSPSNTSNNQSAKTKKTPKTPTVTLPAPPYNPAACFTRTVPSTITPWPHNFSAPTPRFTQQLSSCPVDWSTITGLKPEQIEAYELRAPWNPAPATFTVVAHQTQYVVNGKVPSEECVRKRFKKACSELFKRTGVYFVHSAIGLDEYGVPKKQQELNDMIDQLANGTAYTAVRNAAAPTHTPTTSVAWTRERPARCRATRRPLRHHEFRLYEGEVVAFRLRVGRNGQSIVRVCDKKLARKYHALIDYKVSVGIEEELDCQAQVPNISFSPAAYDLWHSSICFGRRHTIPQRITICREVSNGKYQLRDGGVPCSPTTELLMETYRLSQRMGSTDASDLILDEIVRRLTSISFDGFAPEDVAMLQHLGAQTMH
ncbi:hypothetical protein SLS59_009390 [Nothophoma quercina]|uniref:Uncharacterized protein n=1 Tax=Nothophoma quercina TaxID=749835 RepID=A0ABR3QLN7_9PLEO